MRTSRSNKRRRVFVTMGDPSGIGPEVLVKALSQNPKLAKDCLVLGDFFVLSKISKSLGMNPPLNLIDFSNVPKKGFSYGTFDRRYGRAALEYIDVALDMLSTGEARALVTGPVNKSSIASAGLDFSGHTEYLADRAKAKRFAMMLIGGTFRVTLATRHVALRDVPRILSTDAICDAIELTYEALRYKFKIKYPRIGVAGLNPHAGDGGLLGREEEEVVRPAIKRASRKIKGVTGPRPPDAIFYEAHRGRYDAVVAMYHDQGLGPLKMLYFDCGVNLTLGLPFVRTSPDHGTAFDIAGRGTAECRSMVEALRLAVKLSGI